jgi:hypothetical protein
MLERDEILGSSQFDFFKVIPSLAEHDQFTKTESLPMAPVASPMKSYPV